MTTFTTAAQPPIVVGVDAHKDTHYPVVLDERGVLVADHEFRAPFCPVDCGVSHDYLTARSLQSQSS